MSVLFVSTDYLNERGLISPNIDPKIVIPVVELVQFKYIEGILGTDLYVAMQGHVTEFEDNQTTIPAAYLTLLETYIQPCMLWYIQSEIALPLKMRFEPGGIVENSGGNAAAISLDGMDRVVDSYKNNGDSYREKMRKFLVENYSNYPELATNDEYDKTSPASSGFDVDFGFTSCYE